MLARILFLLGLLFLPSAAFAADNATLITPCASSCVTMRSKDVGSGVQSMIQILGDTSGNAIYGTAGTANSNVLSVQGIASGTALPVSAASLPLPTGAATSANQTNASQKTQIVDGSGNVIASTSNNLNVQCANCSGSGVSAADEATFTQGTTLLAATGGFYNTSPANLASGTQGAVQMTADRFFKVTGGLTNTAAAGFAGWTSGTSVNATQVLFVNGNFGAPVIQLTLTQTSTLTGGAITLEGEDSNGNWSTLPAANVIDPTSATLAEIANPYTLQASTNKEFAILPGGYQSVRARLSTAIAGSGTVTPSVTLVPYQALEQQYLGLIYGGVTGPIAAGSNGIGTVNPTTAANWGIGATASAVPANAIYTSADAQSAEPAKATSGNLTGIFADLTGKLVTSPYANRENLLRCAVTLTASTSATTCTGMGAQGAGVKIYVTDLTCTRSDAGTTSATMTLNDSATTIIDMPDNGGGGGFAKTYNVPLVVPANTAFQVQSGTSLSSVHCSATGFAGY